MALKKTLSVTKPNFNGSLTVNDAYWKVATVKGSKSKAVAEVTVFKETDIVDRQYYSFEPLMNGDNFIKQAYLHLKTLPEFAGAQDC